MVKKASLAIILPAYKGRFLSETLDSVAAQTCRDFVLYIGDDVIGRAYDRYRTDMAIVRGGV